MSNADIRGRFIWHELMTTDPDAASTFYSRVIPWRTQPSGMPSYTLWMSGKNRAGGLMTLPASEPSGTPPHWLIYVGTPNVDATVEAARQLGGRVVKGAADIPNVGRFAVLADPQGAAFAVFSPAPSSGDGVSPGGAVGDFTWHELATTDLDAALRFYTELFGWRKGAAHDMGPMGIYQLISHGGQDVGGVYKVHDASTPPSWLSYTRVPDAAKAAAAVKAGGGRILNGPMEVPGGSWIVMALDPQGGAFAVVEAPKSAAQKSAQPEAGAKKPAPPATSQPSGSAASPPKPPSSAAAKPTAAPSAKPAAAPPAKPTTAAPAKPAGETKPAAAPTSSPPTASAATKAAPKPAARKKVAKRKAAAKSAGRTKKRAAAKRGTAKRGAKKRATAKRGAVKRRPAARTAKRAAKRRGGGKARKHR